MLKIGDKPTLYVYMKDRLYAIDVNIVPFDKNSVAPEANIPDELPEVIQDILYFAPEVNTLKENVIATNEELTGSKDIFLFTFHERARIFF